LFEVINGERLEAAMVVCCRIDGALAIWPP